MKNSIIQYLQIIILFLPLINLGCSTTEKQDKKETSHPTKFQQDNLYIYWVDSLKVKCVGVAPMQCLQIQKGNELRADGWSLFYGTIKGFKYEQGNIYKISVQEEPIPSDQIPADGSSISYTLIKVLDKQIDSKLRLHDIWALETIKSKQLDWKDKQKRPLLEINLHKMQIFGNDGCNNFTGGIKKIDSQKITFNPVAVTRKACVDMNIPNRFHQHINNVQTYSIKNLKLQLFDNQGNELFGFRKVD